ncbi:MAG: sugar phosphate isomerase/epimerase [Ruminococcaceae bacterium]|nr:sugar phosphate isomerase/epimerase [Oscillospiraceae bacterium]
MKTAVSSYSFRKWYTKENLNIFEIINKAKEIGFEAIEFTNLELPPENEDIFELADKVKKETDKVGIEISCYSVSADLLCGSDGDLEKEIEKIKRKVDVARILGVKMMRHDATFNFPEHPLGFNNVLPRLAEGCRKITEYAEQFGIKTMVENHGFFCQDSDRMEALVNAVAHKNFGLQVDMGNFLCADEDPVIAVSRCARYAFNAHVKDFIYISGREEIPTSGFILTRGGNYIRGTVAGHGIVPIKACVNSLKKAGYDGFLTLEFEGWEESELAIKSGCELLDRLVKL